MNNSGVGDLKVSGFREIPLDNELKCGDRFAHGINEWQQVPAVTMREITMVSVMNSLTDKPDWHKNVFNEEILAQWRREAFTTQPLMSDKAWAWCVEELRDKAIDFTQNQYIRVLDTGSCVCKSDTLVPQQLQISLLSGIKPLLKTRQNPDRNNDGEVLTTVDPFLYPLVYGRSPVLMEGGRVEMPDVNGEWRSSGAVTSAPYQEDKRINSTSVQEFLGLKRFEPWRDDRAFGDVDYAGEEAYFWSFKYQWLPSEVEFTSKSDSASNEVKITSYINNLHPAHNLIYRSLETLISLAINLWNECLIKGQKGWERYDSDIDQRGRVPLRIVTYGAEWENEFPEWTQAFDTLRRLRLARYLKAKKTSEEIRQDNVHGFDRIDELIEVEERLKWWSDMQDVEPIPEPTPELWKMAQEYLQRPDVGTTESDALPEDWEKDTFRLLKKKHAKLLRWKHPEPGIAFSYQDWKSGENNAKPVVEIPSEIARLRQRRESDSDIPRPVHPDHKSYSVRLQDTFPSQGLQVIIKFDGVELTPENPKYHGSDWQLQGQMNEHIVAVAVYVYDAENVSESQIAFRQQTRLPAEEDFAPLWCPPKGRNPSQYCSPTADVGKDHHGIDAFAEILGFEGWDFCSDNFYPPLPVQELGRVALPQGRLVTFPNVLESRRDPFELLDPTKPGHHRCVTLMLVDPNYRVCSTRNVPPQQHDWIPSETNGREDIENSSWSTMGSEEAEGHRKSMMKERAWMHYAWYNLMK